MTFNVRVFVNGEEVKSSDLPKYQIQSKAVDRIVRDEKLLQIVDEMVPDFD